MIGMEESSTSISRLHHAHLLSPSSPSKTPEMLKMQFVVETDIVLMVVDCDVSLQRVIDGIAMIVVVVIETIAANLNAVVVTLLFKSPTFQEVAVGKI